MPTEKSYATLKSIWEQVALKFPDGNKYILFKNNEDLVYLYSSGFVDEKQYTINQWLDAFKDSQMPNGAYRISEGQWLDKVVFHYSGPTPPPFDPMSLADGEYSEKDMNDLVQERILPSVYFTAEEFKKIFDEAKPTFFVNGKYVLNQSVKEDLKQLIEMYPSPAYIRGLGILEAKLAGKTPATASSGANTPQKSGFAMGPSASQIAAQKLSGLLSRNLK